MITWYLLGHVIRWFDHVILTGSCDQMGLITWYLLDHFTTFMYYNTACLVTGQVHLECASICNITCANMNTPQICPLVCVINGCQCPAGTVINEETNSCVAPSDCPATGKVFAIILRTCYYVVCPWLYSYFTTHHWPTNTCRCYTPYTWCLHGVHMIIFYSLCGDWSGPTGVCITMSYYMLQLSNAAGLSCCVCG